MEKPGNENLNTPIKSEDDSDAAAKTSAEGIDLVVKYESGIIANPDDPVYWIRLMTHYTLVIGTFSLSHMVFFSLLNTFKWKIK